MFGFRKKKFDFYLGGPMRGYPDLNFKMFAWAAHMLRSKGFTVWNPAEHANYLKSSFGECMVEDLDAIIHKCRKIALLPGWNKSLGANMEVFVAFATAKEAVEIKPNEDKTDFDLAPFVLSNYRLPYAAAPEEHFDPHE